MKTNSGYRLIGGANGHKAPEPKPPPRSHRALITAVGVVVVLIGAIAVAGQDDANGPSAAPVPTAAVDGTAEMVHSERGAAGAAARYATLLGGESMFIPDARRALVDSIAAPGARSELQAGLDADYTAGFNARIGLDEQGRPPQGSTFVSRTMPAGTKVTSYEAHMATVDVWCSGLFGVNGEGSKTPVRSTWFTMTITLQWDADRWKLARFTQADGPEPDSGEFGQAPLL